MMGLNYQEIINKIKAQTGLSEDDIQGKIKEKLNKLSDLISKEGAAHIVANELNVKIFEDLRNKRMQLKNVIPGMRSVSVLAKVLKLYNVNTFKVGSREGKVASFLVGDETGRMRLVFWDTNHIKDIESGIIKEGTIIKLKNGYSKQNQNGFTEIHTGNQSSYELNPEGETVTVADFTASPEFVRKTIAALTDTDNNISIAGTIVQVFDPKFYPTCSQCGKKVEFANDIYTCKEHGQVNKEFSPILNFFFDDGTDSIRVVAFKNQVERILNIPYDQVLALKDNPNNFEALKSSVLGKQLEITGRVNINEMMQRKEFMARNINELNPAQIAKQVVEQISV